MPESDIVEFFLKRDEKHDGTPRARVFACQSNGFIGLASDDHTKAAPVLRAKFDEALEAFGYEKARDICLRDGEFRLPKEPRSAALVERELAGVLAEAAALRAELQAAGGSGIDSKIDDDEE